MRINQFDPEPDPHFPFLCEHGTRFSHPGDKHWCFYKKKPNNLASNEVQTKRIEALGFEKTSFAKCLVCYNYYQCASKSFFGKNI